MPFKLIEDKRRYQKYWVRRKHERRKSEGLCAFCGTNAIATKISTLACVNCLYKRAQMNKMSRLKHYSSCIRKDRDMKIAYLESNRCIRCGAPLIGDETRYCLWCMSGR